jgi:ferritin-like protein
MSEYHEPWDALPKEARDFHRAVTSLKEELEAVDWYHQRVVVCDDPELRAILAHNRDEEVEHACMTLEWLRRNVPAFDRHLRTYLFTNQPITEIESSPGEAAGERQSLLDLGIGTLGRK